MNVTKSIAIYLTINQNCSFLLKITFGGSRYTTVHVLGCPFLLYLYEVLLSPITYHYVFFIFFHWIFSLYAPSLLSGHNKYEMFSKKTEFHITVHICRNFTFGEPKNIYPDKFRRHVHIRSDHTGHTSELAQPYQEMLV